MKITAIVCFCGVSMQFFFLSISADGLYDFYSVIVDPFYFHSLIKLTFLASKDFCVYMINKITHGRAWIRNFSSCVQLDISLARSAHLWAIEVNTRREFPYPHVPMYYSLFNKHFTGNAQMKSLISLLWTIPNRKMLTTTLRIWSVGPGIVSITLYFDFLRVYWITVLATETSWTFLLTLPTKYVPLSAWTPEMQSSTFTTSIHSLMISYKLLLRNTWYDKSLKFRERVCSSVLLALLCDWSENS